MSDLERQLEQLLASKSEAIRQMDEQQAAREREQAARVREMEEQQAAMERELQTARDRADELAQTVESLEREQEEEEEEEEEGEGEEEELETLRETIDSLNQQLTSALEELEGMQRR